MRYLTLLLLFALSSFCSLYAQDDIIVDWDYRDIPFKEFAARAESHHHVRFFFKDEWVSDLNVGFYGNDIQLKQLLNNVFKGSSLYYFIDEAGNIVLTKDFAVKINETQTSDNNNFIRPTEYYEIKDSRKLSGNMVFEIGNPAEKFKAGSVVVSGYITDRDTKEPVSGATVYIQKLSTGTLSNEYGFYSLTLPRGVHLLQFSFIGMKEVAIDLNLYGAGELNVEMNSVMIALKEAVVSAQKNITLQRFEVGVERVNMTTLTLMPTSVGELDVFKSMLMIPGVKSVGEGSAGFNVRGGSADQNLILLYGAPIYNSSHFFGFFSAINSDIIKDLTLYKGGIPSRYGGRISSVLDIGARDGSRNEFNGNAGISPVTTHFMIEGPIKKDTLFYILTARTTYSNWVFRLFDNPSLKKSSASFYDINARLTYDIDRKNKVDLSTYLSHDAFRFNSDTLYSYNNNIIALRWRHFYTNRFFAHFSLNNSHYNYDISSESTATEAFVLSHRINSTGVKADFNYYQGRHEMNFGADATWYIVSPGIYSPASDSSLVTPASVQKDRGLETGVYFDDKFVLTDYLSLNVGIRVSSFLAFGPKSVYLYDPYYSRGSSTVTDTVKYRAGSISKAYGGPEFRASLNFRPAPNTSLKINYNRTRQYLHLLSNTTSISPTDNWKLSDYYLKPQIGDQYALGLYQVFFRGKVEASLELYYKNLKNMVEFKGGANIIMNRNIEQDLILAKGKAYGMELALKKNEGRLQWSIGYIYSRTFLKSTGQYSDEVINNGKWFPANIDKPHDLVVSFNYLASHRISLSTNYTWSTGRPITYPIATYRLGDMVLIHYSDRNKYRIPNYMRLDAALKISGNLRSKKIAHPYWTFSVYNLLGRENVYSIYFKNEKDKITGYKLSVFGRAIPSVTFSFDF